MTDDYKEENPIVRTEIYLNDIVLDKSLELLRGCDGLDPVVEEVALVDRCVDAIALNACKGQLVSGLAHLECDGGSGKLRMHCQDWHVWDSGPIVGGDKQRVIVETLIDLVATENITTVTLAFLFGMLRMAIEVDAESSGRRYASSHATQNNRLPIQLVVRVLYLEQLRAPQVVLLLRRWHQRDNYASLRRENRELKLEVERMRMRLTELEQEQGITMQQGACDGRAFLASLSRGIGRIALFGLEKRRRKKMTTGAGSRTRPSRTID
ncbi:hypothetical protein PR202_gb00711 [Eleusine coracana subsp. coracana]|uniref:Uncharacterized protein n=1 Tax=Eleusine coracana subsp. coracana TaxID=191504 RepID=A0AAV5DSA2_ELECO|nr:hypothetical protein PR202_gb00711 [Eleusine coracana subsp. coracana]